MKNYLNNITEMNNKRVYASGTIFYNDCKSLERTLNSLKDKMDWMICVDGRFKDFKDDNSTGVSTDGSRELVLSYDNAILLNKQNTYEIQKRQEYVNFCGVDTSNKIVDYLLIVDSDEYIIEKEWDEKLFRESCINTCESEYYKQYNVFAVMCEINSPIYDHCCYKITGANPPQLAPPNEKQFAHHPRLWHRPYEMQYNITHYQFINKDPKKGTLHHCETNAAAAIIPGIKIGHDHSLRTKEFLEKRLPYQTKLVELEQKRLRRYMHLNKRKPKVEEYESIMNDPKYAVEVS